MKLISQNSEWKVEETVKALETLTGIHVVSRIPSAHFPDNLGNTWGMWPTKH